MSQTTMLTLNSAPTEDIALEEAILTYCLVCNLGHSHQASVITSFWACSLYPRSLPGPETIETGPVPPPVG